MINIAICDDNKAFLGQINEYMDRYIQDFQCQIWVKLYTSGESLLEEYHNQFSIIFLDVRMKGINGIEVAKIIRKLNSNVIIVFITSIYEYVSIGYSLDASNYIMKPLKYLTFSKELMRLIVKCNQQKVSNEYILVKNDNGLYKLYYDNIKYVETYKHSTVFKLDNNEAVLCYDSMKVNESKLKDHYFTRCHTSYLVNLRFVNKVEKFVITLRTGEEIAVSQKKKTEFMSQLAEYFGKEKM